MRQAPTICRWSPRATRAIHQFSFVDVPPYIVLEYYTDLTGRKVEGPGTINGAITVRSAETLTKKETLAALLEALAKAGIRLVPTGTNAVKAIQTRNDRSPTTRPATSFCFFSAVNLETAGSTPHSWPGDPSRSASASV